MLRTLYSLRAVPDGRLGEGPGVAAGRSSLAPVADPGGHKQSPWPGRSPVRHEKAGQRPCQSASSPAEYGLASLAGRRVEIEEPPCDRLGAVKGGRWETPVVLVALALLAAQTVGAAASTDAWGAAKRGVAHLLGRGDPDREKLAGQRLDQAQQQLQAAAPGQEMEQVEAELVAVWRTRLADLLEEDPDAAAELRALVEQIQSQLPDVSVSAGDHSVAAGRDVNITASEGGVSAGVIHGNVSPPGPTRPGPAAG